MIKWGRHTLTTRYFIVVSAPGSLLGIIDSIIFVLSFGYIHTGFGLDWMMKMSLRESRRNRKS